MCLLFCWFSELYCPHLSQNNFCLIRSLTWCIMKELSCVMYLHLSHCSQEWDLFGILFESAGHESLSFHGLQWTEASFTPDLVICGGWQGFGLSSRSSPSSREYFCSRKRRMWSRVLRISISSRSRVLMRMPQLRQITSSSDITTMYLRQEGECLLDVNGTLPRRTLINADLSPLADQFSEFLDYPGPWILRSARGQGVGAAQDLVVANETPRRLPRILAIVIIFSVHDPENAELAILLSKLTARTPMAAWSSSRIRLG